VSTAKASRLNTAGPQPRLGESAGTEISRLANGAQGARVF